MDTKTRGLGPKNERWMTAFLAETEKQARKGGMEAGEDRGKHAFRTICRRIGASPLRLDALLRREVGWSGAQICESIRGEKEKLE